MKEKLKIVISNVGLLDYPSGIFNRSLNLAKELAAMGNEVTFLTTQYKGFKFPYQKITRNNVTIISFPSILPIKIRKLGYTFLPIILKYLYIRKKKFNICHSDNHRPTSYFPLYIYRKMNKSKLTIEWMDHFGKGGIYDDKGIIWKLTIGQIDNYLESYAVLNSDGVVVLSDYLDDKVKSLQNTYYQNTIKIWGGSDTEEIKYYDNPNTLREKYNIPKDLFLICVGNVSDTILNKNKQIILNILLNSNNSVLIRTGSNKNKLDKELSDKVFHYTKVDYKIYTELLSISNVFLLIQNNNGRELSRWPNSIGDFFAAGRPTIIQPFGEAVSCVFKYENAFIPFGEKVDYVSHIKEKCKKENHKKIRKIAETEFSWRFRAQQLYSFYGKISN